MPEGDTVWLAAQRLHAGLAGRVLRTTEFRVPQLATTDLTGRQVLEVVPRGKHLLTRVEGGLTLHTHLRMDGSWRLYPTGDRWNGGAAWQIRVVLGNSEQTAVGYRLPIVHLLRTEQESRVVGHLGPDLLDDNFDAETALGRLMSQPEREIGLALLDQRMLAGLGNLYRTEVLFIAGLTPWTRVGDVPDLAALVGQSRELLRANRGDWRQATTGSRRPGEEHWVFERQRRPCRRCGTAIRVTEQGPAPYQRLTYWCPQCQVGPSPDPARIVQRGTA